MTEQNTIFRALEFDAWDRITATHVTSIWGQLLKSLQMLKLATLVTGSVAVTKDDFSTPPATTLSSAAGTLSRHSIHRSPLERSVRVLRAKG